MIMIPDIYIPLIYRLNNMKSPKTIISHKFVVRKNKLYVIKKNF